MEASESPVQSTPRKVRHDLALSPFHSNSCSNRCHASSTMIMIPSRKSGQNLKTSAIRNIASCVNRPPFEVVS